MPRLPARTLLGHIRHLVGVRPDDRTDRELLHCFLNDPLTLPSPYAKRAEGKVKAESAFAVLLQRHGPLVWAVCRRALGQKQDAEDAFQAAFLVLAQKAKSIRNTETVGGWLHGVACRMAMNAKRSRIRRQRHEHQAAKLREDRECAPQQAEAALREMQVLLDEEVGRLPEKYRSPFILCCLEGRSRAEAAAELGWKEGTLSSRIAHARALLQERLTRRGVMLSAALTAGVMWNQPASAALIQATQKAAALVAAGQTVSAAATPAVAALVDSAAGVVGVKAKLASVVILAGIIGSTVGLASSEQLAATGQQSNAAVKPDETLPIAEGRKPRTDFQGDPLPPEAIVRLGTTHLRHGEDINSLHFTPDGKVLVARSKGGVRTWETGTGKLIQLFPKESEGDLPPGPSLSPDGKLFATPGEKKLHIWETATAKLLRAINLDQEFPLARLPVSTCCFSPDGKLLASPNGNSANDVTLWNPATGEQIRRWTVSNKRVMFLAFAGDSKTLITASQDNTIRSWNSATGAKLRESAGLPESLQTLALSPDGKHLAFVGFITKPPGPGIVPAPGVILGDFYYPEPFVHVWDVAAEKEVRRFMEPGHEKKPDEARGFESLAFTPDGKTLLAGSVDGGMYTCSLERSKEPRRIWQGSGRVSAVTASPDSKTAAVAVGSTIHLIDLASGKDVFPIRGHPQHVYKTAITSDGRTVVTASGADLYLWDVASGRLRKRLQGHNGYINGLEIIDGGRKAVTSAYQDGTLRVWDLVAEKEAYRIESADKANILQAVSPDGKTIAVGGPNSLTVLFDARSGEEIQRLEGYGKSNDYGAAFTPDGRMLVVWYCEDNMVYLWDLASGKKVREYAFIDGDPPQPNPPAGGRPVYFAAVSPDGRLIAFGSQSRFFEVRDLATGEVLYRETKLPDGVCPMVFSPDSRSLAWSGWWGDPSVHVVEIATGKDRRRFTGHTGRILSLSFSADGTKLVSGSADTTALVWDLTGKSAAGEDRGTPLSAKDIETGWEDLAKDDSARAYYVIRNMSAAPREPIAFFRQHIKPVPTVDEKRLTRLIADLDAEEFAVRQNATQELERLAEGAVEACRKALKGNPSAESRRRLERLLSNQVREQGRPSPDRLRLLRALEILERARTSEARQFLEQLSKGAPGARLTREAKAALERLDRHRTP
jgi:RNA polymerase sigma factor (sigma-70 family)